MKRMQRVFGDLDALRYVDRLMDDERRAAFMSHLADDPVEAGRVAMWGRQNDMLRATFASVVNETVPISLRLTHIEPPRPGLAVASSGEGARLPGGARTSDGRAMTEGAAAQIAYISAKRPPPRQRAQTYRMSLGAAALFAMAATVIILARGLLPQPNVPGDDRPPAAVTNIAPTAVTRATEAFATYALDPVHPVEFAPAQIAMLSHWAKRRLGVATNPADLAIEGWSLLGGRLVPGNGSPGALYVYENGGGDRLGLFIARATGFPAPDVALEPSAGDSASLTWVGGPLVYVLTAAKSVDWMSRNGEAIRTRVMHPTP